MGLKSMCDLRLAFVKSFAAEDWTMSRDREDLLRQTEERLLLTHLLEINYHNFPDICQPNVAKFNSVVDLVTKL